MTLNLEDREMEVLEQIASQKGMTKTGIMRQALRVYQQLDIRLSRGERIFFSGDDGKSSEVVLL